MSLSELKTYGRSAGFKVFKTPGEYDETVGRFLYGVAAQSPTALLAFHESQLTHAYANLLRMLVYVKHPFSDDWPRAPVREAKRACRENGCRLVYGAGSFEASMSGSVREFRSTSRAQAAKWLCVSFDLCPMPKERS